MCLLIKCCVPGSSNEEAAEQEEIEAMALQKRMAAALREDDFEVAEIDDDKTPTISKSDKRSDTNLVSCHFVNISFVTFLSGNRHSRSN